MLKFFCYNFTDEKTTQEIIDNISKMIEQTKQYEREEEIMLFVFVPTLSLESVLNTFERKYVKISAQTYSINEEKPIIGEQTLSKLKSIHTDMVITGLADSRFSGKETNEECRDKLGKALNEGFKTMLCIGETEEMAENGTSDDVLRQQIMVGCSKIPYEAHYRVGIIYRPLWAFGKDAKPSDKQYMLEKISFIRKTALEALPDFPIELPLFYGGILSPIEAKELIDKEIIDGIFVDSINMSADEFISLIHSCCK